MVSPRQSFYAALGETAPVQSSGCDAGRQRAKFCRALLLCGHECRGFRFDDCSIDVAVRELRCAGERVSVPPLVFDCLVYLIRHRDRAVGRDELVAAGGKTHVSDAAMGKAILTARRAVGDTGEAQRCLRTLPRFGYRWSALGCSSGEHRCRRPRRRTRLVGVDTIFVSGFDVQ